MIDLYTYATPNGRRVSVMLEETGLAYRAHKIDLHAGEQLQADYLRINPSGRIPAIIDTDLDEPLVLTQSAAILIYLAEKTGSLLPSAPADRARVLEWLCFHATDITPTGFAALYLGSLVSPAQPKATALLQRRNFEMYRHFDRQLAEHEFLAGDAYSIADIAALPAVVARADALFADYPSLRRWAEHLLARPAVQRGLNVPDS